MQNIKGIIFVENGVLVILSKDPPIPGIELETLWFES